MYVLIDHYSIGFRCTHVRKNINNHSTLLQCLWFHIDDISILNYIKESGCTLAICSNVTPCATQIMVINFPSAKMLYLYINMVKVLLNVVEFHKIDQIV